MIRTDMGAFRVLMLGVDLSPENRDATPRLVRRNFVRLNAQAAAIKALVSGWQDADPARARRMTKSRLWETLLTVFMTVCRRSSTSNVNLCPCSAKRQAICRRLCKLSAISWTRSIPTPPDGSAGWPSIWPQASTLARSRT